MTLIISKRPRKTKRPALRRRSLGLGQPDQTVVPTTLFAPELERILTKVQDELRERSNGEAGEGAIEVLAGRLAHGNGHTPERYKRRIYDWRKYATRSLPAKTVDRIYQAVGEQYTDTLVPLAEFPTRKGSAREMVDTWCEDWSDEDKEALATKLLHFGEGFCLGWEVIDLEVCNGLEVFFRGQYR